MPSPEPDPRVVEPSVLAERRARRADAGDDVLRARAADAERRLAEAETQLSDARHEQTELRSRLQAAERDLRLAREREQAEARARADAESAIADQRSETSAEHQRLRGALAAAEERGAALEREVAELTRELAAVDAAATQAELERLRAEVARRAASEERLTAELAAERLRVQEVAARISVAIGELPVAGGVRVLGARAAVDGLRPDHPALTGASPSPAASGALVDDIARARERLRAAADVAEATRSDGGVAAPAAADAATGAGALGAVARGSWRPLATATTLPAPPAAPAASLPDAGPSWRLMAVAAPDPDDTPSWLLPDADVARGRSTGARVGLLTLKLAAAALPVAGVIVATTDIAR